MRAEREEAKQREVGVEEKVQLLTMAENINALVLTYGGGSIA